MIDIYELLKSGKSMDDVMKILTDETNAAQKRINEEKAAIAAQEKKEEAIKVSRDVAATALTDYFSLVIPDISIERLAEIVEDAFESLETTAKMFKNVTIRYNGKPFSIFDL